MNVTDKEYQEKRIKITKEKTIWDTYTEENISPDDLIARINQAKDEILNNGLGVDEDSMFLDTYRYDIGAELNLNWMQFETIEEYKKRIIYKKQCEEIAYNALKDKVENNFEAVCRMIEEIKQERSNGNKDNS